MDEVATSLSSDIDAFKQIFYGDLGLALKDSDSHSNISSLNDCNLVLVGLIGNGKVRGDFPLVDLHNCKVRESN